MLNDSVNELVKRMEEINSWIGSNRGGSDEGALKASAKIQMVE